ncbi:MAG TPA: metalloregulator ArsR/SmtB family transcription factor [bacterium]|nr:metalloregulator ArsR/SmtB family transcription factor [bacterium]
MRKTHSADLQKTPLPKVFQALSDPARLGILRTLLEKGEAPCSECDLPVSKSTLSHHYKVLRQVGLITTRSEGTRQVNCLDRWAIERRFPGLLEWIDRME